MIWHMWDPRRSETIAGLLAWCLYRHAEGWEMVAEMGSMTLVRRDGLGRLRAGFGRRRGHTWAVHILAEECADLKIGYVGYTWRDFRKYENVVSRPLGVEATAFRGRSFDLVVYDCPRNEPLPMDAGWCMFPTAILTSDAFIGPLNRRIYFLGTPDHSHSVSPCPIKID